MAGFFVALVDTLTRMMIGTTRPSLRRDDGPLARVFLCSAAVPALVLGIVTMRQADVPASAWLANLAAACAGALIVAVAPVHHDSWSKRTAIMVATAGIAAILLPFLFPGADGVHRWFSIAGVSVHAASIAAPALIVAVAVLARHSFVTAASIAKLTTAVLAVQPDAAQATGFAAASVVLVATAFRVRSSRVVMVATLLLAVAFLSLTRPDPLPPVAHVEGIFALAARGPARTAFAALALLLLPLPFFGQFRRHRDLVSLALGVYVLSIVLAPFWGTFPVPVMGYGVSPILGYFLALAFCRRTAAGAADHAPQSGSA